MNRSLWISSLLVVLVSAAAADDLSSRRAGWERALAEADPARRAAAAHEIANLGSSARALGPALLPLLRDPDLKARAAGIRALGAVGHRPALGPLIDEVTQGGPLWLHAVHALAGIPDPSAVPALRQKLTQSAGLRADGFTNRVGEVRALLLALGAVGPAARVAEAQVEALLVDPQSPVIRVAAVRAWSRLATPSRRQASLRRAFAARPPGDLETRRAILEAFGAQAAEPATLRLLHRSVLDEQEFVAEAATRSLGGAAPRRDPKSRALLLQALLEDRGRVSTAAARSLADLGAKDAEVLQALERVARDESRDDGEDDFLPGPLVLQRACREALRRLRAK